MDQGNTDPNNSNPNNPISGGTPGSFGTNPSVAPAPSLDQSNAFSQPPAPLEPNTGVPSSFMPDAASSTTPLSDTVQPSTPPAFSPSDPVANPPMPAIPGNEAGSNWANPVTPPDANTINQVPAGGLPVSADNTMNQTGVPPQGGANPFAAPAPTPFNPFSSPNTQPSSSEPIVSENAPTDLSNLVNTPSEAVNYMPQTDSAGNANGVQPESLMVSPPQGAGDNLNQAVSAPGASGGFPKIVFIIAGVILLAVIAVSAYFILGIGKPSEPLPASIPAEQESTVPGSEISPTPSSSTQSASFSSLPGSTASPSAAPSGSAGGSAYNMLLKGRTSTPSANQQ